jgi:DNA polymerase III subunit gamma/tau
MCHATFYMQHMTLYLKYRPQTLSELDLVSVRNSLAKIVESENIPHAFLFTGPKGTGKTSAARIVAKYINCEMREKKGQIPCNKCDTCISITKGDCLDVIEIDAASHRGIDDVRALREAVKLSPLTTPKKVYIIDECHMLTTEASNALLKTLEEPPSHVVFVLATTNPEKLIPTILSRCSIVQFTKATNDEMTDKLEQIAKGEKVTYEKSALSMIADVSDGAFRDAIKKLEQCIIEEIPITEEAIGQYLFHSTDFNATTLIELICTKKPKEALAYIEEAIGKGLSAKNMVDMMIQTTRKSLIAKVTKASDELSNISMPEIFSLSQKLIDAQKDVAFSPIEQLPLELLILSFSVGSRELPVISESDEKQNLKPIQATKTLIGTDAEKEKPVDIVKNEADKIDVKANTTTEDISKKVQSLPTDSDFTPMDSFSWRKLVDAVKRANSSTEALLRAAKPMHFDGTNLTIGVYYKFHKEKLESRPHKDVLVDVIQSVLGQAPIITCILTEPAIAIDNNQVSGNTYMSLTQNIPQSISIESTIQTTSTSANGEIILTETKEDDIVSIAKDLFKN